MAVDVGDLLLIVISVGQFILTSRSYGVEIK